MTEMTVRECKKMIFNVGIKLGVSPRLISERLLSDLDKIDMREGLITIEALEANTVAWMENGMPDYAHGKLETYEEEKRRISVDKNLEEKKFIYRKPFVEYSKDD